jgi:hypothetical protein
MAFWTARRVEFSEAIAEYDCYNAEDRPMFLLEIKDGQVSLLPKPHKTSDRNAFVIGLYVDLIQQALRIHCLDISAIMAVDLDDHGQTSETAPIFAVSKRMGDTSVLLPHQEFMEHRFHRSDVDETPYSEKSLSAVFAGSTTGHPITPFDETVVHQLEFPRLRSAVFFKDHPLVDFWLPNIVQATPAAERLLRDMGFGGEWVPWREQFKHKFIISMDGNAATCSRVTVSLKSNSALMKYQSDYLTHYFYSLIPWLHYIPIRCDHDVEMILRMEQEKPDRFKFIAEEGTKFFHKYLNKRQIINYTAELLKMYAESFAPCAP